jgi:hypothetical protein
MRKLLLSVAVVALVAGCADDIIIPPDPPIEGKYYGEYIVTKDYGTMDDTTVSSSVYWEFDGDIYRMNLDSTSKQVHCFCNCKGQYSLGDVVRLEPLTWWAGNHDSCEACDEMAVPQGQFKIISRREPLLLKAVDEEAGQYRELRLNKISPDETEAPRGLRLPEMRDLAQ